MKRAAVLLAIVLGVVIVAFVAFNGPRTASPSPSPSGSGIANASSSSRASSSRAPTPTPTRTPTPSPSPSPTPTPSPTPSPTPVPTPIRFSSPDGYSLTLPARWVVIPVGAEGISGLLALLGQSQPQVAELIRSYLEASGATVSMVGVDPAGAIGGLPPSAIVLLQPTFGLSLDLAGGIVATALGQVPGVVGGVERVKIALPAGDAIRLSFEVQASGTGQTSNVRLVQYLFVRGNQGYLVTFTTLASNADRDTPVFDAIVSSLTFP